MSDGVDQAKVPSKDHASIESDLVEILWSGSSVEEAQQDRALEYWLLHHLIESTEVVNEVLQ